MNNVAHIHTQPQRMSQLLGQVATIAKISKTSLGLRRLDKQASQRSDQMHNALSGTGKTTASRLAGAEHRIQYINDIANEIVAGLKRMTTRWGNDDRLLANDMMKTWFAFYGERKIAYDEAVAQLIADAPALIADAEQNKGSYNVAIPTLEEFKKAFSITYEMVQIPDSDAYVASNLDSAIEAEMKRRFEANIEAAYVNAQQDAMKRVAEPLAHLVERIATFEKVEQEKANGIKQRSTPMYESAIGNINEIAKVFRSFNLTNDPLLNSVADRLEAFDGIDIEDVKTSETLRKDLSKRADAILADLKDLI